MDGPGGTGKTYLYDTLLATVRGRGGVAPAVASGIAALLMPGGATAHSLLKILVTFTAESTSGCGTPQVRHACAPRGADAAPAAQAAGQWQRGVADQGGRPDCGGQGLHDAPVCVQGV